MLLSPTGPAQRDKSSCEKVFANIFSNRIENGLPPEKGPLLQLLVNFIFFMNIILTLPTCVILHGDAQWAHIPQLSSTLTPSRKSMIMNSTSSTFSLSSVSQLYLFHFSSDVAITVCFTSSPSVLHLYCSAQPTSNSFVCQNSSPSIVFSKSLLFNFFEPQLFPCHLLGIWWMTASLKMMHLFMSLICTYTTWHSILFRRLPNSGVWFCTVYIILH